MAKQIRVTITEAAYKLLNQAVEEREASYGDVVTDALLAFLSPEQDHTKLDLILQYSARVAEVQEMLEHFMKAQNCYPEPKVAAVQANGALPIATFAQLYPDEAQEEGQSQFEPPPAQEAPQAPSPSRRSFLGRLLYKERNGQ